MKKYFKGSVKAIFNLVKSLYIIWFYTYECKRIFNLQLYIIIILFRYKLNYYIVIINNFFKIIIKIL
jgi:hypothetical protein